jgi:hypothetical protein
MARDPYWLHAYWEVTPATIERAKENLGAEGEGHRWVLRVHSYVDPSSERDMEIFDVDLEPDARNWYVRVPYPERSYRVTVGLRTRDGAVYPFARSARITTPRAGMSGARDSGGRSAPEDEARILTLSGAAETTPSSPGLNASAGAFGAPTSGGVPTSPSGLAGAGEGAPVLGAGPVPGSVPFEGASSPAGEMGSTTRSAPDNLPLHLRADLILFGSTHPDARLTVQDRPVGIRPDGTFSVRFELPDGEQKIPCVARSADGRVVASVTSTVQRTTIPVEPEPNGLSRPEA